MPTLKNTHIETNTTSIINTNTIKYIIIYLIVFVFIYIIAHRLKVLLTQFLRKKGGKKNDNYRRDIENYRIY